MRSIQAKQPARAAERSLAGESTESALRAGMPPRRQTEEIVHARASGSAMSEVMRTVIWVTGVAFGITAPAAFAQDAQEETTARISPAFQKLDVNHDGFFSRGEVKRNASVDEVPDSTGGTARAPAAAVGGK